MSYPRALLALLMGIVAPAAAYAAAPSLSMGPTGLVYTTDSLGNRIPDYSYAGYMGGGVALPVVPNKVTIRPVAGDNTTNIQNAINKVAGLPQDANGFRGAVLLAPGTYTCTGTLSWSNSGVVLRGSGANTIILATGAARTFLSAQGGSSTSTSGSAVNITDPYVPCNATSFTVADASSFAVGNTIIISRPSSQTFINDIHMDSSVLGTEAWTPTSNALKFERTITKIQGNVVTIDIPITNPIEQVYTTGTIQKYSDSRISSIGMENLTLQATFNDVPPVVTPGNVLNASAANFSNCKNSWIKGVTVIGYGNGITFGGGAKWCTMMDCSYQFPCTDNNTSAQPAAYTVSGRQCLVVRANGTNGFHFHHLVTQAWNAGPDVFLDCLSSSDNWLDSGPHQKWASGLLFDRIKMQRIGTGSSKNELDLNNRNTFGTGQGWSMAFSTAYNCQVVGMSVQEPTYAVLAPHYNWCIGGTGNKLTSSNTEDPNGEYQNFGTLVKPSSLYLQQLQERLGTSAVSNIGYPRFTGNYKILAKHDLKAVAVLGASLADGASVVQATYSNTAPANDEWTFVDIGAGKYQIKNVNSGKVLAVQGNSPNNGASIVQTSPPGDGSDQWTLNDFAGGYTQFVNKSSGKSLEVPGSSTAESAPLDQNTYSATTNQQFLLVSTQ